MADAPVRLKTEIGWLASMVSGMRNLRDTQFKTRRLHAQKRYRSAPSTRLKVRHGPDKVGYGRDQGYPEYYGP